MSDLLILSTRSLALTAALMASSATWAARVPDPMRPAVPIASSDPEATVPPALVLQSTLISPTQRSVIINGRRYRLGETVGDARIEAIGPGWARLSTPSGRTELRLSYSPSTRPVNR